MIVFFLFDFCRHFEQATLLKDSKHMNENTTLQTSLSLSLSITHTHSHSLFTQTDTIYLSLPHSLPLSLSSKETFRLLSYDSRERLIVSRKKMNGPNTTTKDFQQFSSLKCFFY